MEYLFYGANNANCRPVNEIYAPILDPRDLYDALSQIWCAYTCAPRMRADYSSENKTLGQCSITAFLAQDIFGGEVYGVPLKEGGFHCFNKVDDCIFDLTSEQFGGAEIDYGLDYPQSRSEHFAKEEKRIRYEYLRAALRNSRSSLAKKEIRTARLRLRPFKMDDAPMMFENWASDPEVTRYLSWSTHEDVEVTKKIVAIWLEEATKPSTIRYAISLPDSGMPIGAIDVVLYRDGVPEIGYCLGRSYWNKGLMSEASTAVRDYLFSLGFSSITIRADEENTASNRIIQKLGGELEKEEHEVVKGRESKVNFYRLFNPIIER